MCALPFSHCERRKTAALSLHARHELLSLAVELVPDFDPAYSLPRLASYASVWIVRRRQRVAAFFLGQEYTTAEATLVYIGPAFSRGGAYAFAFAELVRERLTSREPFTIAMEVANPSVGRMLKRLVPSHVAPCAQPGNDLSEALRAQAARLLAHVPHVIDFDPHSMTSAVACGPSAGNMATRYAVLLVPCDGTLSVRASIARELGCGLRSLLTTRLPTLETRDG